MNTGCLNGRIKGRIKQRPWGDAGNLKLVLGVEGYASARRWREKVLTTKLGGIATVQHTAHFNALLPLSPRVQSLRPTFCPPEHPPCSYPPHSFSFRGL